MVEADELVRGLRLPGGLSDQAIEASKSYTIASQKFILGVQ